MNRTRCGWVCGVLYRFGLVAGVVLMVGCRALNSGAAAAAAGVPAGVESAGAGGAPVGDPPAGMAWEIEQTWLQLKATGDGKWPQLEAADTSGYEDLTDDRAGTITASGEGFPNEVNTNAFDNTEAKWCIKTPTIWVQYQFPGGTPRRVAAYTITSANDAPGRDPKNWQLLGSNDDGQNWQVVDERSNQTFAWRHQKRLFTITKPGEYRLYKLDVTENHGDETSQLEEIELLAPKP